MDYNKYQDVEMIAMIRNGNDEAMDFLLEKYRGMVRKETRKMYLIGSDEEDLMQEGMIGLFKAIRDFDTEKEADFALFAHICIVRQLCSAVTASNRKKHTPLNSYISLYAPIEKENQEFTLQEVIGQEQADPEAQFLNKERVKEIWKRINDRLSTFERRVLEAYLEGDSYEQIAQQAGKNRKSIDNAIQRIRCKLADCL